MKSTSPIVAFLHCRRCVSEVPGSGQSPGDYARLEAGLEDGQTLILWCRRHDELVGRFPLRGNLQTECDACAAAEAGHLH